MRWTRALGMDEGEARHLLALAGYFDVDRDASSPPRSRAVYTPKRPSEGRDGAANERTDTRENSPLEPMLDLGLARASSEAGGRVWRRSDAETESIEQELVKRMRRLLRDASAHGRAEEVQRLLDSYLHWLQYALEHER